jgi:O-antigen ligase
MLRDMRTASFYAAWVALLLALSEPRRSDQAEASTAS